MTSIKLEGNNAKRYLIAYSSKYGSTAGIALAIGKACHTTGATVEVLLARTIKDLSGYDGVLIGSGIYMGGWRKEAIKLVKS